MRNRIPIIINIFLAVGLGVTCLHLFSDKEENKVNDTLNTIMTRTSIRNFTSQKVEEDKVEQLLRAGMAAPTAMNCQPWEFVVINDRKLLDQLCDSLPSAKMLKEAQLAIIVCGNMQKTLEGDMQSLWVQDASAASENILLAAHALGLGAVWTGVYPSDNVNIVRNTIKLPEHIVPLNVIPIGYPKGEHQPKDKWKHEKIHYNAW